MSGNAEAGVNLEQVLVDIDGKPYTIGDEPAPMTVRSAIRSGLKDGLDLMPKVRGREATENEKIDASLLAIRVRDAGSSILFSGVETQQIRHLTGITLRAETWVALLGILDVQAIESRRQAREV